MYKEYNTTSMEKEYRFMREAVELAKMNATGEGEVPLVQ